MLSRPLYIPRILSFAMILFTTSIGPLYRCACALSFCSVRGKSSIYAALWSFLLEFSPAVESLPAQMGQQQGFLSHRHCNQSIHLRTDSFYLFQSDSYRSFPRNHWLQIWLLFWVLPASTEVPNLDRVVQRWFIEANSQVIRPWEESINAHPSDAMILRKASIIPLYLSAPGTSTLVWSIKRVLTVSSGYKSNSSDTPANAPAENWHQKGSARHRDAVSIYICRFLPTFESHAALAGQTSSWWVGMKSW